MFAEFFELAHKWREVTIARDDHKGINVILTVCQVHGIHTKLNVRAIFTGLGSFRNFHQLNGRFMQKCRVGAETAPVAIGFFSDDFTFFKQAF